MPALREIYARKALSQIPRLLGNLDRSPFSPTYGCFHRDYWLDKTSDFPDAVRQFAVHALALVYTYDMPGNIYHRQPKVRDWILAALDFWARIQHPDGSFDEFYPYERGWVGPTAFTTFTSVETYRLMAAELPANVAERVRTAILRAARFVSAGEAEEDHLANHHAMACLAVWKAHELFDDKPLKQGYEKLWQGFLRYYVKEEGWSREYDGIDPGYLSATVSFLGKIYETNKDPDLCEVLRQSVDACSYFVYPNGFYAGSMGSRNTLHLYPHGFEILARELPLAAAVAEKSLAALGEDKLVPPEIISDRYVAYRVPEYLQAYLSYTERPALLPPLPYERQPFTTYFELSRIYVANRERYYVLANLAKGGTVKVFDKADGGRLVLNDCGLIGQLTDGRVVTSQWVDPTYEVNAGETGCEVHGDMHAVPSHKVFTLTKNLIFRTVLLLLGWWPAFSHLLKGQIRKTLILGKRPVPIRFRRTLTVADERITLTDDLWAKSGTTFSQLAAGDEFFVRYVPQSRYFQAQELEVNGLTLDAATLTRVNRSSSLHLETRIEGGEVRREVRTS